MSEKAILNLVPLYLGYVECPSSFAYDLSLALSDLQNHLTVVSRAVMGRLPDSLQPPSRITELFQSIKLARSTVKSWLSEDPTAEEARAAWAAANESVGAAKSGGGALLLAARRLLARLQEDREALRLKSNDASLIHQLQIRISHLAHFLSLDTTRNTKITEAPRPEHFLTLAEIANAQLNAVAPEAHFDEKFGLLRSPRTYSENLKWIREQCEARRISFTVAYADIDKFGDLNKDLTETVVDRDILPVFMRVLDASCFNRGIAFREGGDEYVVILPNMTGDDAITFFDNFNAMLDQANFSHTLTSPLSVSTGILEVPPGLPGTPQQLKAVACAAKARAKQQRGRAVLADQREKSQGFQTAPDPSATSSLPRISRILF